MTNTISSRKGRNWLMSVIGICFISTMISLTMVSRDGAIGTNNLTNAVIKFLGFYLPLLSLIAAFVFKDRKDEEIAETPRETFFAALFICTVWAMIPLLLVLSGMLIENVLEFLDKLIPVGQSLALMALGYYFSKSSS